MTTGYTSCADTEPLLTEYLLGGYPKVPRGDVTLVFGDGAAGKGRLIMSWVAEVINSDDEAVVILVLPEDHPAEEVVPRLIAAGVGDRSRVVNMTRLRGGSRFKLSADTTHDGHIGLLREAVEEINADKPGEPRRHVRMIIVDPVAAVVGWGSIQTNAGARRLLEPIQDLCQDTGIAGVVVAHTVTGGKLQGSYGLQQAARVVYRVSRDRNNPTVRVIGVEKANNLPPTEDLRFVIEGDESGHVKVIMLDQAEIDRRQRSWRAPALPVVPPAGDDPAGVSRYVALMSVRKPGQGRPEVLVLSRYPADATGAALARRRCEAHRLFSPAAGWETAGDELLSRYELRDGTSVKFAVAGMAG